ncbi:hypothetical protein GCM10023220_11870 [Streptomyces ziwulingensis]|uniref:Uncharacterized protein n=1 Tax=Streptomyces ziwulingensis TaxID=1045501 RepID=A0ABP9B0T4_9ACTN
MRGAREVRALGDGERVTAAGRGARAEGRGPRGAGRGVRVEGCRAVHAGFRPGAPASVTKEAAVVRAAPGVEMAATVLKSTLAD